MNTLPVTDALVTRVLDLETDNIERRLRPCLERPGNPQKISIRRFGQAVAFASEVVEERLFNSVLGAEPSTVLEHLDAIEAYYDERGAEGAIEIAPGRLTEPMGRLLGDRGYAMVEFHAALVRPLGPADAEWSPRRGVDITPVDPSDPEAFERFMDVYLEGWESEPRSKDNLRTWRVNADRWSFWLLTLDGEPALAGILDIKDGAALNASAGTRPAMRGRGAQREFLRFRVAEAARRGCDLIVGGAYFGTSSMRNHQREGFACAFTRGIWTRR